MRDWVVAIGGVWEGSAWEVRSNVDAAGWRHYEKGRNSDSGDVPCPHAFNIHDDEPRRYPAGGPYQRAQEAVEITTHWTVPRVVVAYNEAGHGTTGVCLDCIADWSKANPA